MTIYARGKLSKNSRISIIILLFTIFSFGSIFPDETSGGTAGDKKALERSLIFPGLGQLMEKKYFNGIVFLAGELFCITNFIINNNKGNDAYENYKIAGNSGDAVTWREKAEKYDKTRNIFLLAGAGVWILNMIDIFFHIKKKYKKKISLSLKHEKNNKISFGIAYSF